MGRYGMKFITDCDRVMTDWNALSRGNCQNFNVRIGMLDDAAPDDRTKTYGWKLPCKQDGTAFIYRDANTTASDDQANVDEVMLQAKTAGGTVYAGFWWPDQSIIVDGNSNWNTQGGIRNKFRTMYMRFRNSVNALPKFCIHTGAVISSWDSSVTPISMPPPAGAANGTWNNFNGIIDDWIAEAKKPGYWYTSADAAAANASRPIIMLIDDGPSWVGHVSTIRTRFQNAGLANPFILFWTLAACTGAGGDGTYNYCGPAKTGFGTTHKTWVQMNTSLKGFFTESGGSGTLSLPSVCTTNDGRSRAENDVDPATYIEAERLIRDARTFVLTQRGFQPFNAFLIANLGEYDESNVLGCTPQIRGLGPTSFRGPYLDALQNVMAQIYPSPVWVAYNGRSIHADIARVGTWTNVQNLTDGGGAYQYEEMQSSTANDTFTITPALACDRIVCYGSKGPSYGTANAIVNAGAPTLCTQTAVSVSRTFSDAPSVTAAAALHLGSPIFDTGALTPGSNNLQMKVVAGLLGIDLVLVRITATR